MPWFGGLPGRSRADYGLSWQRPKNYTDLLICRIFCRIESGISTTVKKIDMAFTNVMVAMISEDLIRS